MPDLFVLHDLGADGGRPWSDAFAGWDGTVVAPDLPGHGAAPAPVGGHRELGDTVFAVAGHLRPVDDPQPVVVGVGRNGNAATVLALAGRAAGLVLVDGLGGPWLDIPGRNDAQREVRRRILATPEACAPHEPGTTDVRADLVLGPVDREHVVTLLAALPVPTLVVESPSSVTPDADAVASVIPDHTLVRVDARSEGLVADVVRDWVTTRSTLPPG